MADQSGGTPADVETLRLNRHAILSTALPFPKLDWSNKADEAKNLEQIRDYSESLANSTLDWYLDHHKPKRRKAKSLHFIMFLFVALASIPPLLKVGFGNGLQNACGYCDWLNNHTGELALLFLGIAGIAKLWDSNAGYTVDWMRFITTAAQINQELSKFQFEWDGIELATRDQRDRGAPNGSPDQDKGAGGKQAKVVSGPPARPKEEVCPTCGFSHPLEKLNPTERKVRLAQTFCEQILKIVGSEIAVWSDELKKRYDKVTSHSSPQGK
jgi:SMODS and SLOG-associating 2TM effector domain 2